MRNTSFHLTLRSPGTFVFKEQKLYDYVKNGDKRVYLMNDHTESLSIMQHFKNTRTRNMLPDIKNISHSTNFYILNNSFKNNFIKVYIVVF